LDIDNVATAPEDMLAEIDLALILHDADGGDSHVGLSTPFLEAGLATFVDRPIAPSIAEAGHLYDLANRSGAPLMTGSSLRYSCEGEGLRIGLPRLGAVSSVVASGPGPWWFYAYHVLEMYYSVFGPGVRSVYLHREADRDVAILARESGHTAVVQVLRDIPELYNLSIFGDEGHQEQSFTDHWLHWKETGPHAFRTRMMQAAVQMTRTRTAPVDRSEVIEQMAVLRAGVLSAERGSAVDVGQVLTAEMSQPETQWHGDTHSAHRLGRAYVVGEAAAAPSRTASQ
jgi:predicted dehydrogenase